MVRILKRDEKIFLIKVLYVLFMKLNIYNRDNVIWIFYFISSFIFYYYSLKIVLILMGGS